MLEIPRTIADTPALRPLLDLLEGRYVSAQIVARRWGMSEQALTNMRRRRKGPAFVTLGRSVRYPLSEILAWELNGRGPHVTLDGVEMAVSALKGFSDDQKLNITSQLIATLSRNPTP